MLLDSKKETFRRDLVGSQSQVLTRDFCRDRIAPLPIERLHLKWHEKKHLQSLEIIKV